MRPWQHNWMVTIGWEPTIYTVIGIYDELRSPIYWLYVDNHYFVFWTYILKKLKTLLKKPALSSTALLLVYFPMNALNMNFEGMGVCIFQDKPLEFLSHFLLKKCSEKSKDLEENVILTKSDPKVTFNLFMKVKLLLHFYAIALL